MRYAVSSQKMKSLTVVTRPIFTKEIFAFFRELKRHNTKVWMDANRDRYQETVVLPFRRLCEEMSMRPSLIGSLEGCASDGAAPEASEDRTSATPSARGRSMANLP